MMQTASQKIDISQSGGWETHSAAEELEQLLPRLMRRLFPGEPDDPLHALPLSQMRVCVLLQSGGRTISSLAKELGISCSAATQLADRLEKTGLVERVTTDDRRMKRLQLSAQGERLMIARRQGRVERLVLALNRLEKDAAKEALQAIRSLIVAVDEQRQTNFEEQT